MPSLEHRRQMSSFLRARRAALSPSEVGLPPGGRRLVKGLRREEVALLADVGLTWYTWLEQGRDIRISGAVARRVSRALRLEASDEAYFMQLAGVAAPTSGPGTAADSALVRAALDTYRAPACVLDPLFNLVAVNRLMERVYQIPPGEGRFARNQLWQFFTNPARIALYADYEEAAPHIVRSFRLSSACRIGDPEYSALIAALQESSPYFARLWSDQRAEADGPFLLRMSHPECGPLSVRWMQLPLPGSGDGMVVLLVADDEHTGRCFAAFAQERDAEGPSA